tara:strand:+ start:1181 stop:2965 length:1785 start_codon:yes stop_codon:yes gene_type:complete
MIRYFTAINYDYGWWAIHLLRSFKNNSPESDLTCFVMMDETKEKVDELIKLLKHANPSARIIEVDQEFDKTVSFGPTQSGRIAAGFRTVVFSNRTKFFKEEDTLVWVDADSIVREDLSVVEDFCKEDFDVSARGKNDKLKFASGFIIVKPTTAAEKFSNLLYNNWEKRYSENEWTADQNAFNEAARSLVGETSVLKAPKVFCDVWLSDEGVIWQAKHQTKIKKRYVDEMRKHRIDDSDSKLWKELSKKFDQIVIDETEFSYKGAKFNFMGISGEPIFEKIRKDNTFYNVDFLEKLASLGNKDATIIVGAGIQNCQVYLNAFTDTILTLSFEPNPKLIDLGLRNAQNNIGMTRLYAPTGRFKMSESQFLDKDSDQKWQHRKKNLVQISTNFKAYGSDGYSRWTIEVSALGAQRFSHNVTDARIMKKAVPTEVNLCDNADLREELFKNIRNESYTHISEGAWSSLYTNLIKEGRNGTAAASFETVDQTVLLIHKVWSMGSPAENPLKSMNPFYNFNNLVGTMLIDVPKISKEILSSSTETISHFRPHIGITFIDDDSKSAEKEIEKMLPNFYEKVGSYQNEIDSNIRSNVYKSNRR